ncbi:MAG: DNA methyltransferase [Aigarchaeota archaeon]|nr:DNA methyltransferase [Aigarchaeota archaeon]
MATLLRLVTSSYELEYSWKIAPRRWGHPLHKMVSRIGSFPPALAHWFITKFTKPRDIVLDPFSGKGTAPLEACLLGRIGIGNDLAPDAFAVTHAKIRPITLKEVHEWVREKRALIKYLKNAIDFDEVPEEVQVFFHKDTLKQILFVKDQLSDKYDDVSMFIKGLMLGILHGPCEYHLSVKCSHSFSMSPNYVKKYIEKYKLRKPWRDVFECLIKKSIKVLSEGIPPVKGVAFNNDAKTLPLDDESVDMILTSPPYLNVLTTAWDNWLRLWFLGYDYRDIERKLTQTSSPSLYIRHMRGFLEEFHRVLKPNKACTLVLGDIKVRNDNEVSLVDLVSKAGEDVGFNVKMIIDDDIRVENKYLAQHKHYNKGLSREKIIVFEKGKAPIYESEPLWINLKPQHKTSI